MSTVSGDKDSCNIILRAAWQTFHNGPPWLIHGGVLGRNCITLTCNLECHCENNLRLCAGAKIKNYLQLIRCINLT